MEETVIFTAERREGTGKGVARKLRRKGKIPGVVYGPGYSPIPLAVISKGVLSYLKGEWSEAKLWDLMVDNERFKVIIKDVQTDPFTDEVLHVDFYAVTFGKSLTLAVPLRFEGEPIGTKQGGVVEYLMDELEIECLPKDIPEEIVLEIGELQVGDTLFVKDLPISKGINVKEAPDRPVVTVVGPVVEKEVVEEELEEVEEEKEE